MRSSLQIFTLLCATRVSADFLGPRYPAPVHLARNDSLVAAGWRNLTSVFDAYLKGDRAGAPQTLAGLENLTFSVGMFSIHDDAAQSLQYHHTADAVRGGPGVDQVDGDSIYRVASISKLATVFAGMLAFTNEQWDQPITDFVPGLAKSDVDSNGDDHIWSIQWEDVTLRALAAQIAGVPRASQPWIPDISILPNLVTGDATPDPEILGLPPIDPNALAAMAPCLQDPALFLQDPLAACPADLYFEGAQNRPPVFQPWTTPAYSNNGFILLGIALANITNKPIAQVYRDLIFDPLGMNNSKSDVPPQSEWSKYVILKDGVDTWATAGGLSISAGGLFASLNDLAKFGTALMNSTLLPAGKTRQWMKPVSHSASLTFSVGAPWEIYRYTHAASGVVTDIYTKLGDAGGYTGFVVLLPDYDAGFNVISTGSDLQQNSIVASTIADLVVTTAISTLEAQAATEATRNFAGYYQSTSPDVQSSLTLALNESSSEPGLFITSWTSNGTDMLPLLPVLFGSARVKLVPSITQPGRAAFRAVAVQPKAAPGPFSFVGPFLEMSTVNDDWLVVDDLTYGGVGVSLFVFEVGADGRATGVSPAATRAQLGRVG
ncbi:hypothetical protein BP6252_14081 [Coleophoma cylindrospora]|uniref:Uncharacterized protein n=1 Tax=Coleophoma cylindrospora TaxID=1849047 RepID=A0A3D8Q3Z5_9HELO|nr:hypothetical protein BP6252_14081 [Coleophoma cylindrospora]